MIKMATAIHLLISPNGSASSTKIKIGIINTLNIVSLLGKFIVHLSYQIVLISFGNFHINIVSGQQFFR